MERSAMRRLVYWSQVAGLVGLVTTLCPVAAAGDEAIPVSRRVLIVQPFGQHFEPFTSVTAAFRTELALRSAVPIDFSEISLETARFAGDNAEETMADYLNALFAERHPDLVVPVGAPSLRFCARFREHLCPDVPLIAMGVEARHLRNIDVGDNAVTVTFHSDVPGVVEDALHVLPETRYIVAVIGRSPLEQFWQGELSRELQAFAGRVDVTWLSEFSFPEVCARAASLPPRSILLFVLMVMDAAGVPYEQLEALDELHDVANAPIFGLFEEQLGRGIVGGRLIRAHGIGVQTGALAAGILENGSAAGVADMVVPSTDSVYDWRELERWGIAEARLPAGSEVRFREPSFWEMFKWHTIIIAAVIVAQFALIGALLYHRRRLRTTRARLGVK